MSTTALLVALEANARADLLERVQLAAEPGNSLDARCARNIPSTVRIETYTRLAETPALVDISKQPLVVSPITELPKYQVENQTWAQAVEISRADLEDDQTGEFLDRVSALNEQGAYLGHQLCADLLINGTSSTLGLCYDGVSLFNANHPAFGALTAVQSNLVSATGQTVSAFVTDLASAVAKMMTLKAYNGKPFHRGAPPRLTAAVPWALATIAREAIYGSVVTSSERFAGMAIDILPVAELDANSSTAWYLLRSDRGQALAIQNRLPLQPEMLGEGSDLWVYQEKALYKVRRRCAGLYGHWQSAIKIS